MPRQRRTPAVLLVVVAVVLGASATLLAVSGDPALVEQEMPARAPFSVRYVPTPSDALLFHHNEGAAGRVVVRESYGMRELANATLPPGDEVAWAFGSARGLLSLAFYLPHDVAPQTVKSVWIGNVTVLIGDTPSDHVRGFRT